MNWFYDLRESVRDWQRRTIVDNVLELVGAAAIIWFVVSHLPLVAVGLGFTAFWIYVMPRG